jgi:hypothetical protein
VCALLAPLIKSVVEAWELCICVVSDRSSKISDYLCDWKDIAVSLAPALLKVITYADE